MAKKHNGLANATRNVTKKTVDGVEVRTHIETGYNASNRLATVQTVEAVAGDKSTVSMHAVTVQFLMPLSSHELRDYDDAKAQADKAIISTLRHAAAATDPDNALHDLQLDGCITKVIINREPANVSGRDACEYARQAVAAKVIDMTAEEGGLSPFSAIGDTITLAAAPARAAAVGGLSDNLAALLGSDSRDLAAVAASMSDTEFAMLQKLAALRG